jgi:cell division initiation protein
VKLSPIDVQQQKFRSVLWGFDGKEVDAFLDVVAKELEGLIRDNKSLREELARRDSELQSFREREQNLKETMLTATRITEDIKQNARKEAEIVVAQAEGQAEQIVQNAHSRLSRVLEDLDELKRQKTQFEETLRSMIQTHMKLLDAMTDRESTGELLAMVSRLERKRPQSEINGGEDLLDPRGHSAG